MTFKYQYYGSTKIDPGSSIFSSQMRGLSLRELKEILNTLPDSYLDSTAWIEAPREDAILNSAPLRGLTICLNNGAPKICFLIRSDTKVKNETVVLDLDHQETK